MRLIHFVQDGDVYTLVSEIITGSDAELDRCVASLASVARFSPRFVIDSIMMWRKSKSDVLEVVISRKLQ